MPSSLFGDELPPAEKRARKKAESDGSVARLFEVYRGEFRRKWSTNRETGELIEPEVTPLIQYGRDGKHLKDLAAAWGEEAVAQLIRDFFASTDPQVTRGDYKIAGSSGSLFTMAQKIRLHKTGNGAPRDQRTAENVDAAHRAMRKR